MPSATYSSNISVDMEANMPGDNTKPLSDEDVQSYIEPYRGKERMVRIHEELKKGSQE